MPFVIGGKAYIRHEPHRARLSNITLQLCRVERQCAWGDLDVLSEHNVVYDLRAYLLVFFAHAPQRLTSPLHFNLTAVTVTLWPHTPPPPPPSCPEPWVLWVEIWLTGACSASASLCKHCVTQSPFCASQRPPVSGPSLPQIINVMFSR